MKLLRKIIFGIIGLVVTTVIVLGVILAISFDTSTNFVDMTKEYRKIDTIVGEETYNSLNKIKETNYNEADNKISIGITDEELNYYIVQTVRANVNDKYLDGEDYIIKKDNTELQSITFKIEDNKIKLKIRVNASFYKTSVNVIAKLSVTNKMLRFQLEDAKVGSLPFPLDIIKAILKNCNITTNSNFEFDVDKFEISMSVEELLKSSMQNEVFASIINACEFGLNVENNKLCLFIDTKDIFLPEQTIKEGNDYGFDSKVTLAAAAAIADPNHNYSLTISEENFNEKIKSIVGDTISSYQSSFEIGGKTFDIRLGNMYYDFAEGAFISNIYILDVASPLKIYISFDTTKSGNYISTINMNVSSVSIGNLGGLNFDSLSFEGFDLTYLGVYNVYATEIIFSKEFKQFTINGKYIVS